jgi:hypothetical protein
VHLQTDAGELSLTRGDGRVAEMALPGAPERMVALPRRPLTELLVEELRRLDADEVYGEVLQGESAGQPAPNPAQPSTDEEGSAPANAALPDTSAEGDAADAPAEGSSEQEISHPEMTGA